MNKSVEGGLRILAISDLHGPLDLVRHDPGDDLVQDECQLLAVSGQHPRSSHW